MIWLVVGLVAAALSGGVVITFWNTGRETVLQWLRRHGLDKTVLTEAVILLDRIAVGIRRRIRISTPQSTEIISEEALTLDQIDDPKIRAWAEQHSHVAIDMLHDF